MNCLDFLLLTAQNSVNSEKGSLLFETISKINKVSQLVISSWEFKGSDVEANKKEAELRFLCYCHHNLTDLPMSSMAMPVEVSTHFLPAAFETISLQLWNRLTHWVGNQPAFQLVKVVTMQLRKNIWRRGHQPPGTAWKEETELLLLWWLLDRML